jgi:hypothetical protein
MSSVSFACAAVEVEKEKKKRAEDGEREKGGRAGQNIHVVEMWLVAVGLAWHPQRPRCGVLVRRVLQSEAVPVSAEGGRREMGS